MGSRILSARRKGRRLRSASVLIAAALILTMLSGCGSTRRVVKIGYVNPTTGALSGNGEGCDWVVEQIYDYVRENPIVIGGREAELEIIVYDSESNPETCRAMAERLASDDKVDLLIATQTPETVIPVTDVAEEYEIPCVSIQAPVDPVAQARETYDWTYHAFWTIDSVYECYRGLWTAAGYGPDSGARVGLLFANDADGSAWHDIFVKRLKEDGYFAVDPGQYDVGNSDFSGVAETFRDGGIDVLTGTNQPPDFINAMNTLIDYGVEADCITMGKCCLLETDAAGMGALAVGVMTEVWWDASTDFVSDLTGVDAKTLGERYAAENFGKQMPQPASYGYAALELAVHTLQDAKSTNKRKLRDALAAQDVNTIVGPIKYDQVMGGLHYGETIISGGQWQESGGDLSLKVIDNSVYPLVQTNGEYKSGNALKGE